MVIPFRAPATVDAERGPLLELRKIITAFTNPHSELASSIIDQQKPDYFDSPTWHHIIAALLYSRRKLPKPGNSGGDQKVRQRGYERS